jgi:hypothetical protein
MQPPDQREPNAITSDDKDSLWLVETGLPPDRFVGFPNVAKENPPCSVKPIAFAEPLEELRFSVNINVRNCNRTPSRRKA